LSFKSIEPNWKPVLWFLYLHKHLHALEVLCTLAAKSRVIPPKLYLNRAHVVSCTIFSRSLSVHKK
jgi:hypothetical protein